jgi:hypothetical protein
MPQMQVMAIGVVIFLAVLIGGYIEELHYFYVTFDIHLLFNRAFFAGLLLGGASGWWVAKRKVNDPIERFQWFSIFVLLGSSLLPLLAIFANHALAAEKVENLPIVFLKEEGRLVSQIGITQGQSMKMDYYITYFLKDQAVEQIRSKIPLFPQIEENTPVDLPIKKGFLGFTFADIAK